MTDKSSLIDMTAEIVAAHVSGNAVAVADLPMVIQMVYRALKNASAGAPAASIEPLAPAVPIKKSITADYVVCLEDGLKFKSMKRHLNNAYGLSPAEYRAKWRLPDDYPMVAPNYSAARSKLARDTGLGRQIKKAGGTKTPARRKGK